MFGICGKYTLIELFLLNWAGPGDIKQEQFALESVTFLKSHGEEIIKVYKIRNYLLMKARLYYVLSFFYESCLFDMLSINNYMNTKAIQLTHIRNFEHSFNGFLHPKCKFNTTYSHFIIMLIHTFYQIEVAKNGANADKNIVLQLIKLGKLSVLGHKRLLDNDEWNKNNYSSRSNMYVKFGKYCLTMNKYYDQFDTDSKYILRTGIKYLKFGMNLRNKYLDPYHIDNIDNYYKLGQAYLCANKPYKINNILEKSFQILNKNKYHKDYDKRKEEVIFVADGLKIYTMYGKKDGHKQMLKEKEQQWNAGVVTTSKTVYGAKQYLHFYENYLNSLDFWSSVRNLALLQQCQVCKRKDKKLFLCKNCKNKKYCSKKCQKIDWAKHKYVCYC